MRPTISAVLFDLDGTLADTAPDLAYALNVVLEEQGRAMLPFERIRPVVSHGGIALIRLGFGLEPDHPAFPPLRERLLEVYRANIANGTRLFPGMDTLLDTIEARGLRWGVVTNKPAWLTEPLMAELGLAARAASIVSGDTLPERKPHPAPLLLACEQSGCRPAGCVYVGDAARDIEAGKAAGTFTLAALYGYLGADDTPASWGADDVVDTPLGVLDWLEGRGGRAVGKAVVSSQ